MSGYVLAHRSHARALSVAALLTTLGFNGVARASDDEWWARDKALHFLASATIAGGTYAAGTLAWDSRVPTIGVALGVTLGVGAAKECWDGLGHGDASWKDFTWDVVGALAGIGLSFVVDTAVRPARATH